MDVRLYGERGAADRGWYVVQRVHSSSRRSSVTHWRRLDGPYETETVALQALRRRERKGE